MKEMQNIEAQIKFEIQRVNNPKPDGHESKNGGSGSPCCSSAGPGPPVKYDPLPPW